MLALLHLTLVLTSLGLNAHGSEIINGKKVPQNLMLYMASVQNDHGHVCGGFLVNEDFVVTAAHCDEGNPTSVVLGTHNLRKVNEDTMRYRVDKCKHPSYKNFKFGDDIMLLKLSKKARLDNSVQPIRLPRAGMKVKDGAKCRVAGWGFTKTRGEVVDALQAVDVPVVNLGKCQRMWSNQRVTLPANVTCAGGGGGRDIDRGFCQGDSGGPLVCGGTAVGVVSFNMNENCHYPNLPNVYTDISKYLHWIRDTIRKKHC